MQLFAKCSCCYHSQSSNHPWDLRVTSILGSRPVHLGSANQLGEDCDSGIPTGIMSDGSRPSRPPKLRQELPRVEEGSRGLKALAPQTPASWVCPFNGSGRPSIFGRAQSQGPVNASLNVAELSNLLRTGCLGVRRAVDSR